MSYGRSRLWVGVNVQRPHVSIRPAFLRLRDAVAVSVKSGGPIVPPVYQTRSPLSVPWCL